MKNYFKNSIFYRDIGRPYWCSLTIRFIFNRWLTTHTHAHTQTHTHISTLILQKFISLIYILFNPLVVCSLLFQLVLEFGLKGWVSDNTKERIQYIKDMEEEFSTNKPPLFRGIKYDYWKERVIAHFELIHTYLWCSFKRRIHQGT